MGKAQLHALHGDQLIQSNHYAVDSIRPKCVELRRVCDNLSNEARKKSDILSKSLDIHTGITKVRWRQVDLSGSSRSGTKQCTMAPSSESDGQGVAKQS